MAVKEAAVVHGYDGWSISVHERPLWSMVGEAMWEWVWFTVLRDPCCKWWIFQTRLGQYPGYWLMQLPVKLFWRSKRWYTVVDGKRKYTIWHYPVHDEWVAEYFPEITSTDEDPELDDEPELKDPEWGTKCPACGYGRVNDDPKKWIASHGKCFRCVVAEKIVYQDPHR